LHERAKIEWIAGPRDWLALISSVGIHGRICSGWSKELSNHEKNDQGENESLDPNKHGALLEQAM